MFNIVAIVLTMSLHPLALKKNEASLRDFGERIFSNVFFTILIGICMAFLSSYSLKSAYYKTINFDNFDIIMMVLPSLVSYLMAESFMISGLLTAMTCAFA